MSSIISRLPYTSRILFEVLLNMLEFYFEVLLNILEYVKYYV
jgi:hypothetical protein